MRILIIDDDVDLRNLLERYIKQQWPDSQVDQYDPLDHEIPPASFPLGNYDVVIFAVPGAWLISEALAKGWLPYERVVLAALCVAPIIMIPAGSNGVPLAPIAEVALIVSVVRRMRYLPGNVSRSSDATCGHACHTTVAAKDYVFTAYPNR